jgi:tetratricopeptide (TPR) repeat protein
MRINLMTRALSGVLLLSALAWLAGCASTAAAGPDVTGAQQALEEGRAAAKKDELHRAIELFTTAVKANPDLAEGWYERGKVEIRLRLDPHAEGEVQIHEENAIEDFSMAIKKNPAYADAYFNRAMILCSRAQYRPAVDDLLNAVRYNPQDPEAHRWLGEIYEKKFEDRLLLAMEHYEKYIDLGGSDGGVREKVRIWKEFRKQLPGMSPDGTLRPPTAEDEKKAQELHVKGLELLKNPDKTEAIKAFEELIAHYGNTKYVQSKLQALQAVIAAFKKKDAPK